MKDLNWSLNPKVSLALKDDIVRSSQVQNDQTSLIQNIFVSDTETKDTTKYVGTEQLDCKHKTTIYSTYQYNQMPLPYMKSSIGI